MPTNFLLNQGQAKESKRGLAMQQQMMELERKRRLALENMDELGISWKEVPTCNLNHSKYSKKLSKNGKDAYNALRRDTLPDKGKWNKPKRTQAFGDEEQLEFQSGELEKQAADFVFTLGLTAYNTWKHLTLNNVLTNCYLLAKIYATPQLQTVEEFAASGFITVYEKFIDLLHAAFEKYYFNDKLSKDQKLKFIDWVKGGELLLNLPQHPRVTSEFAQDHYARWCIDLKHNGGRHFGNALMNTEHLTAPEYLALNLIMYHGTNGRFGAQHLAVGGLRAANFSAAYALTVYDEQTIEVVNDATSKTQKFIIAPEICNLYELVSQIYDNVQEVNNTDFGETELIATMTTSVRHSRFADLKFESPATQVAFDEFSKSFFGEDNNLFMSGPLGTAARSLMSALSIAPLMIATGKVKNYDEYIKWYNEHVKVWDIGISMSVNLMNFIMTFLKTGLPYLLTGDATFLYPTQKWEKFIQIANSIVMTVNDNMAMAQIITTTPEKDVICAIDSVIQFGRNTWMSSRDTIPHSAVTTLNKMLETLHKCRQSVHRTYVNKKNNPIPMCVKLYGGTGVGKSQITQIVARLMCYNLGLKSTHNVYFQNMTDKYQSGYTAQEIMVMDDVGAENVDNVKNESLLNFLSLSTEVPVMTNQAAVEDKGTVPYNLKGIIMTTNFEDCNCRNYFKLTEPFLRRFLHVTVKVKPEFAINNNTKTEKKTAFTLKHKQQDTMLQLDPDKAKGRFDVQTFDCQVYENGEYHPATETSMNMEFDEFEKFFLEWHKAHIARAGAALRRTNDIENSEFCPIHECFTYKCKCPVERITEIDNTYELLPYEDNVKRGIKELNLKVFEGLEGGGLFKALLSYQSTEVPVKLEQTVSANLKKLGERIRDKIHPKKVTELYFQGWFKDKIMSCVAKNITAKDVKNIIASSVNQTVRDFKQRNLDSDPKTFIYESYKEMIESKRARAFLALGALGATLSCVIALYRAIKPLISTPEMFQGLYKKKYATEEEKDNWSSIDSQFIFPGTRMPYPPKERVASQQSITPGHFHLNSNLITKVEDLIKLNTLYLSVDAQHGDKYQTWGLALGKNMILVNAHSFKNGDVFKVVASGQANGAGLYETVLYKEKIWFSPDTDTAIFLMSVNPFKSIPLAYESPGKLYAGKAKFYKNNCMIYSKLKVPKFEDHMREVNILVTKDVSKHLNTDFVRYITPEGTEVGNCGNPIFVPELGLLGIHSIGSHSGNTTGYTPVFKSDIEAAAAFFQSRNMLVTPSVPQDLRFEGVLQSHPNSVLLNTAGNHHVIGSLTGHRGKMTSKIRKSMISHLLPDPGKVIPHMQPILTENGEWIHPVQVKLQTIAKAPIHANERIVDKALEFLEEHLKSMIDWDTVRPTGFQEIIQGVEGTISEPMNLSTSAGPGLSGKFKRDHVRYLNEDNDDRIFDKEVQDSFLDMLRCWKRDEFAFTRSKWFYKDEVIKPSKQDAGRQRLVSASGLRKIFASKMCFKDIFLRIRTSGKSHMCVGMNAASKQWSSIPERLKTLDPKLERVLDSDYEFYDAYCYLLNKVLALFIKLLKTNPHYNKIIRFADDIEMSVNDILHCLAAEMCCYPVEVAGELLILLLALESGADSTAEFNSLMETLIHYMIWVQCYADFSCRYSEPQDTDFDFIHALIHCPNPNKHMVLFNYGDDNLDTCSEETAEWYTPTARKSSAAKLGFPITDARKQKELKYVPMDKVVFLKRSFIWNEEAQAYFAPLDEAAINQIMYFVKGDSDTLEVLTYNNVRDAHRQYFMYGRERFEQETIRLKSLLQSVGLLELSAEDWPTFDQLLDDFKNKKLHMGGL